MIQNKGNEAIHALFRAGAVTEAARVKDCFQGPIEADEKADRMKTPSSTTASAEKKAKGKKVRFLIDANVEEGLIFTVDPEDRFGAEKAKGSEVGNGKMDISRRSN